jgi:hypothetical protein
MYKVLLKQLLVGKTRLRDDGRNSERRKGVRREGITFVLFLPLGGVGRAWRYCKSRPTRGEVGASSCIFSSIQKSV